MTANDRIKSQKIGFDLNRKAAKIDVLLSGDIVKCEYPAGKEILFSQ